MCLGFIDYIYLVIDWLRMLLLWNIETMVWMLYSCYFCVRVKEIKEEVIINKIRVIRFLLLIINVGSI